MAEHDDAQSPIGDDEAPLRAPTRAGNPLARGWAWFNAQPTQTKVIIVGVIVVLGVVAWMALRNKNTASTSSSEDVSPGKFRPLGASGPIGSQPTPVTAIPPTDQPAATAPPVTSSIIPGGGTPRPITATAAPNIAGPLLTPVVAPAAVRPANIYPVTPEGMSPTMRGTDIALSGTTVPINQTKVAPIGYTKKAPTPQLQRPTVISAVPTQRGTNVNF